MDEVNIVAPPLDMDLATVDTSMPLLKDNEFYSFAIDKAELKPTNDKKAAYLSLDCKTTMPAMSIKGEQLGAGIHVFGNLMISPSGKSTWEIVGRNLGEFVQSIQGGLPGAKLTNVKEWVQVLPGRTFVAKVGYAPAGIDKNGKAFKEKNEFILFRKV
jgi:hypothetical protein